MASTNYLSRVIIKEHTAGTTDFAGEYKLLVKSKSMPAPVGTPNMVETTTYEDDSQTFVEGIKQSEAKEFTGNLEKEYLDAIDALAGKQLDVIQLYGSDGIGGVAKYAYVGTAVATPSETSGTDGVLEMSVTVTPNSTAKKVTDAYTVVDGGNGTFTVSKK